MQEPHVNTCYKHFYYFVCEFNLVDKKELEPLVSFCIYLLLTGFLTVPVVYLLIIYSSSSVLIIVWWFLSL